MGKPKGIADKAKIARPSVSSKFTTLTTNQAVARDQARPPPSPSPPILQTTRTTIITTDAMPGKRKRTQKQKDSFKRCQAGRAAAIRRRRGEDDEGDAVPVNAEGEDNEVPVNAEGDDGQQDGRGPADEDQPIENENDGGDNNPDDDDEDLDEDEDAPPTQRVNVLGVGIATFVVQPVVRKPSAARQLRAEITINFCRRAAERLLSRFRPVRADQIFVPITTFEDERKPCALCVDDEKKCETVSPRPACCPPA